MNIPAFFVAALIPMIVGFIYYHKNVVGTPWMAVTGMTEEKAQEGNMTLRFIVSYILSVLLAFALSQIVIHQSGVFLLFGGNAEDSLLKEVMNLKGNDFRTFKHGALHGFFSGLFIALLILGTNALFEQKGWKYIFINVGY